jgi:methylated-DNA-[protein]-cysteine S-methyltransferase
MNTIDWFLFYKDKHPYRLAATDSGLCALLLPNEPPDSLLHWMNRHGKDSVLMENNEKLHPYWIQLKEYWAGRRTRFTLPIDLKGSPFQRAVWQELQTIPYGTTRSYSEVADAIGRPKAVRAVGTAIGQNPIPIMIPCHRVVGKDGRLAGYRGGLALKRELLRLESAHCSYPI